MSIETSTEQLRGNIRRLFLLIGDQGNCRGCGQAIYWIKHKNGKVAPYTEEALNHFADCPKAKDFKRKLEGRDL